MMEKSEVSDTSQAVVASLLSEGDKLVDWRSLESSLSLGVGELL